jgi:subtilisin family serine protease
MFFQSKKSIIFIFLFFCALTTILSGGFGANADENKIAEHQAGEILVKLKNSDEIFKFKFASDKELQELLNFYNSNPKVEYAEPNYIYKTVGEPLDVFYPQQIYLSLIKANQAWNITTGSPNVTIAIIDTGVDINHPDLKDNIWTNQKEIPDNGLDDDENGYTDDAHGWDFLTNSKDPSPKLIEPYSEEGIDHGTVVAGVAAAKGGNNIGIAGVVWNAKIMPLRVLDGAGTGTTDKVAEAIDYAVNQKADIINLSFVGSGNSKTLEASIKRAYENGILVVAAAGNEVAQGIDMDLTGNLMYPVCYSGQLGEDWVLGVAATDNEKQLASFSNYGKNCVDISAPGLRIFSTVYHNDNNQEFSDYYMGGWTGSSVSAPQVAGAAALIKSLKPNFSLDQIHNIIIQSAQNIAYYNPIFKDKIGSGLLDVYKALTMAIDEKPTGKVQAQNIITTVGIGGGPYVKIFKKYVLENEFFAYDANFKNGLSLAGGDFNSDGQNEIAIGLGRSTYPWVKIFSESGALKEQITAFALNFRGGVEVASGDINGDGIKEIITAAGVGGGPQIRIFDGQGNLKNQFFAFDKKFYGGIEIATGDITGDGIAEIIAVPKGSMEPLVKIFNFKGEMVGLFLADKKTMKRGLHVSASDVNSDGRSEIIIGASNSNEPYIKIFDKDGKLLSEFLAFAKTFRGGVWVASGDVDGDGIGDVVVGAGIGGGPQVRVLDMLGGLKFQFFAYNEKFRGGVRVGVE